MKKFFKGLLIAFVVIIAAAFIIPFFFKDKLIGIVTQQAENYIDAKPHVGKVDLSILKNIQNFPNIALTLKDVDIVNKAPFEGDTLLHLGDAKISLDLMSVIKGSNYKIEAITLKDVILNAVVNKDSMANWNIIKSSSETDTSKASPFSLALKKITLDNINLSYNDFTTGNKLNIQNLNHDGKGDFTKEILDYTSTTEIAKANFSQGLITYLKEAKIKFDSKLNIDQPAKKYTFKDNKLSLNDLGLLFTGFVQQQDNNATNMDIEFKADKTDFKSILSLIPAIYAKDFNKIKTSGKLQLDGIAKGIMQGKSYPQFALNLNVKDGFFQYPDLPTAVKDIAIDAHVKNPGGSLDNTVVNIPDFHINIANEPIDGSLNIATPISNPDIDLAAKGKLNLTDVQKFYPSDDIKTLKGNANLDLKVRARQSDIVAKNYQNILASGNIAATGIEYRSKDVPKPISVSNLLLNFTPQYVAVDQCIAKIGSSDFDIKGKLDNVIGYVLVKGAKLGGNINIVSNKINANEFLPDSTSINKTKSQKAQEVMRIPDNIDLNGTASVKELLFDKLNIKDMVGNITLKDEQLNLNNLSANLLGGSAIVSGFYNTKTDIPTAKINYHITSFDIQQLYKYSGVAKNITPIMQYISGTFSSNMDINTTLNPDLSPDLKTINGTVGVNIPLAIAQNVPVLNKIKEMTQLQQLDKLQFQNVNIKTTFVNGRMMVDPFTMKANNLSMTVGGSQGMDQTVDYAVAIDVPWKELGKASSFATGLLAKNPIPQLNGMVPEIIRLNLKVGGTLKDPKITMGKPDGKVGGGTMKDVVKEQVQQQVQQIKEEVKTQAKQTLDTLKQTAKEQAKNKLNEILTGQKDTSTNSNPAQNIKENVKENVIDKVKNKFPWPR